MSKTCFQEGCLKKASFNISTETKALFCLEHKQENMIDVKHKKCIHEGCDISSCFNFATETKPLFCNEHKKENMINVTSKKCNHEGCIKTPSFNLPNNKNCLFCNELIRLSQILDLNTFLSAFLGILSFSIILAFIVRPVAGSLYVKLGLIVMTIAAKIWAIFI